MPVLFAGSGMCCTVTTRSAFDQFFALGDKHPENWTAANLFDILAECGITRRGSQAGPRGLRANMECHCPRADETESVSFCVLVAMPNMSLNKRRSTASN